MWELLKELISIGADWVKEAFAASEEEQAHALERMTAVVAAMRASKDDWKARLLKRNEESIAAARKQAAELASSNDEPTNPGGEG